MIGTSFSPRCRAASSRPWPATISPSSDTITGAVQPYSTSDAAILAIWSSEWVRAFLEYGFRRATGHCSICSGRKRSEVTGDVLEGETAKGRLHRWTPVLDPGWLPAMGVIRIADALWLMNSVRTEVRA